MSTFLMGAPWKFQKGNIVVVLNLNMKSCSQNILVIYTKLTQMSIRGLRKIYALNWIQPET